MPCTIPANMLTYPHIDPVALQIGPLAIHWYGLTYLAAFGLFMLLGIRGVCIHAALICSYIDS